MKISQQQSGSNILIKIVMTELSKNQKFVEKIVMTEVFLRRFDLNDLYGPSRGISRLSRLKRSKLHHEEQWARDALSCKILSGILCVSLQDQRCGI